MSFPNFRYNGSMRILPIIISLIFLFSPLVQAKENPVGIYSDGSWEKVSEKDGLTIFSRKMDGSNILGFKLTGNLNAYLPDVLMVLRNVEASSRWTPDLIGKTTIEEISDLEAITYSINDMPWPLNNRDMILHNKLFLHKEKKLLYVMSSSMEHESFPKKDDNVRAYVGYSNMGFRPISMKQTYMEWTIFADPKGIIPSWLINFYQKRWPINFFRSLEKRAQEFHEPLRPGLKQVLKELLKIMNLKNFTIKD